MKKHPIASLLASGALALAALLTLHPTFGDESGKVNRKGSIDLSINPKSPDFDLNQVEKDIRERAETLGLEAPQRQQLDDAIKQLREKLSSDKNHDKFNWRWEFNANESPPPRRAPRSSAKNSATDEDESAPRGQRKRPGQDSTENQGQPRDFFRQLLEESGGGNGRNFNPQKMLEEMLRQFGMDDQGNGNGGGGNQRQFRFRLGPGGLQPQQQGEEENQNGRGGNRLEQLQRMFGARGDHSYNPDTAPRDSKYSRSTLAEYRSTVKSARESTVAVSRDGKQISLGTVVTANGYILSKASEVGKSNIDCEFVDGRVLPAKLVSKLDKYDLALLKVDAANLKAVMWDETELAAGTMLAASGIDEDPVSVGVVSVTGRNLDESQKGFLGVGLEEAGGEKGVAIRPGGIVEDGPAFKAGLEDGDTILSVDGKSVNHPHELMRIISSKSPDEVVKLEIKSAAGKNEEVEVTLGNREAVARELARGIDPTAQMGTDLSGRPSGFPEAITNDLGINANQCGGPVVDIAGNIVGLNIARSGRTSTYMISGKNMKSLLSEVESGKLTVLKDSASLDKDVKKAEAALKAAQDALKSAQEAKEKIRK